MNTHQLASLIAKLEGKKSQAHIGDIKETLIILKQLLNSDVYGDKATDWMNKPLPKKLKGKL